MQTRVKAPRRWTVELRAVIDRRLWLAGAGEQPVEGPGQRGGAHRGQVAPGLRHGLLAALERIGLAIARRHVGGEREALRPVLRPSQVFHESVDRAGFDIQHISYACSDSCPLKTSSSFVSPTFVWQWQLAPTITGTHTLRLTADQFTQPWLQSILVASDRVYLPLIFQSFAAP